MIGQNFYIFLGGGGADLSLGEGVETNFGKSTKEFS